jgi:hypothetical protein
MPWKFLDFVATFIIKGLKCYGETKKKKDTLSYSKKIDHVDLAWLAVQCERADENMETSQEDDLKVSVWKTILL